MAGLPLLHPSCARRALAVTNRHYCGLGLARVLTRLTSGGYSDHEAPAKYHFLTATSGAVGTAAFMWRRRRLVRPRSLRDKHHCELFHRVHGSSGSGSDGASLSPPVGSERETSSGGSGDIHRDG